MSDRITELRSTYLRALMQRDAAIVRDRDTALQSFVGREPVPFTPSPSRNPTPRSSEANGIDFDFVDCGGRVR